MNSKSLLNEAVDYFSQRKIYSKLFKKFLKKYEGLGRFGETVNLTNISREEKEELEGFLGENFLDNGKISISFKLMETSLMNSKFSILTWEEIISTFFNIKLISKKEKNLIEEEEKELFFNEIIKKYEDNIAKI